MRIGASRQRKRWRKGNTELTNVSIDRSGSGLVVVVSDDSKTITWSSISDQSNHFSEPIIRAMAAEIEKLRNNLDTLFIGAMYGCPPLTWNEERQKAFVIELREIEADLGKHLP